MSTLKSLRLDDFVIKSIETLADTNNISFNKQIGIVMYPPDQPHLTPINFYL